ncbi:hypothetical protein H257_04225 [Aphanomyces astaci]|uniref:Uncharacterized protein n=1 Tax=Aphanomyces astaci TaxID=112090 RepID=W4GW13_APHAT|nr:hypothetical protein H257_04225 [Aphanomyces astaci]ETV83511.1 hypothetical protein H257_04225 [Aphanomyces astaci]|eukprot:XP_009826941.1 hypothetical protein H257_04225 [Aphanomyces astaci]
MVVDGHSRLRTRKIVTTSNVDTAMNTQRPFRGVGAWKCGPTDALDLEAARSYRANIPHRRECVDTQNVGHEVVKETLNLLRADA